MELIQITEKIDEIQTFLSDFNIPMTNGINTLNNRIKTFYNINKKELYENTKYGVLFNKNNNIIHPEYSEEELNDLKNDFLEFKEKLPQIIELLNFDVISELKKSISRDSFEDEWMNLSNDEKESLVFFDKEIYSILRRKLQTIDFSFILDSQTEIKDNELPDIILRWINMPKDSKVMLFKLQKESVGTEYEPFFKADFIKAASNGGSETRTLLAIDFLTKNKLLTVGDWYRNIDLLHNQNSSFHYCYHYLQELEDEFNGYVKIKEKIVLPELLKEWIGWYNTEDYQSEMKQMQSEEKIQNINDIAKKYPTIHKVHELQKQLPKEKFKNLQEASIGTEFEEFFYNKTTIKMYSRMAYQRKDYMFVFFRDKFMSEKFKTKIKR